MGKLCIYLPPFASDYSGVCSALFEMDCLAVINDASCCTNNYVFYDEPRWKEIQRPTVSSQIRSIDMVFGNDNRVLQAVLEAAEAIDTETIALVGTPVPAITGMDLKGIAFEVEQACGRPAIGFTTTGFDYYDKGIADVGKALVEKFGAAANRDAGAGAGEDGPEGIRGRECLHNKRINILGLTPLDFGIAGNDTDLRRILESAGWTVNASLFMNMGEDDIKNIADAHVNLAVSAAGVRMGEFLERKFGTPWIAGFPMGHEQGSFLLGQLQEAAFGTDSAEPGSASSSDSDDRGSASSSDSAGGEQILIVGDQVIANSMRQALSMICSKQGTRAPEMTAATFFNLNRKLAQDGDIALESEKHLIQTVRTGKYSRIICDPIMNRIPDIGKLPGLRVPHPAVSGRLHWDSTPAFAGKAFEEKLRSQIRTGKISTLE